MVVLHRSNCLGLNGLATLLFVWAVWLVVFNDMEAVARRAVERYTQ